MKPYIATISLLCTTLHPLTGHAQDVAAAEESAPPLYSAVEFGLGYSSADAFRFGRYSGLTDAGPFLLGDIDARHYTEDGGFWRARGTNLGLDSRYLRLEAGQRGRQHYFLEYDRLPNNETDTARTPFLGVGTGTLTLPAGFSMAGVNGLLLPFDIETTRERIGLGATFIPRRHWSLDVAYRHETRGGVDRIGSVISNGAGGGNGGGGNGGGGNGGGGNGGGGGGGNGLLGNATAALLPEPIDYTTRLVDVTLNYARGKGSLELGYHLSLFDNGNRALTWEDPFAPGSFGSQALEPDNEFHQLTLTGSYALPYKSQVTAFLSRGRMSQNDAFLPYTVNPAVVTAPLPRTSFDGEVWVTTAQLALSSRPASRLRLNARYRHDARDNNSPIDTYDYIVADSDPGTPLANRPLGYARNQLDLSANYRINTAMSLRGGYQYDDMSRDYANAERADTKEHTLFAKWKVEPHEKVDLDLHAETGRRDGSNYQPPIGDNPALRKYHLADRDRIRTGAALTVMPTNRLDLTASADYIREDYDNSVIGLTAATRPTWTVDVAWRPHDAVTTHAWYTREAIESSQAGSEAGTPVPDWNADFDDTVHSAGLGARISGIRSKWDIGADLAYTRTSGAVTLTNLAPPFTVDPFPDLASTLSSLKLWTLYHYRRNLSWSLGYRYERYRADNWALDNLQADSVNNLLLLDEETADYDVHVVTASVRYHF